jgi:type I restriction enzyme S subunit
MEISEKSKKTELRTIPREWNLVNLDNLLSICQYGLSSSLSDKGTFPVFRMNNIENGYLIANNMKYIDLDQKIFEQYKLEKEDILINRTNSIDLVGKLGIFLLNGNYTFASYLIRMRTKKEKLDPMFLNLCLNSDIMQYKLKSIATAAVSQANINAANLKSLEILLPPLKEQQKIASILSNVDELIQKIELIILTQKKLYKYFIDSIVTGKITENWRKINNIESFSKNSNIINQLKFSACHNKEPKLKLPLTWKWNQLGDLLEYLTDYHSNGSYDILKKHVILLDEPNYSYIIRATNFVKNDFSNSMKYITKEAYEFLSKSKLYGGEILIGKIGNAGSVYYMPNLNHPSSLGMNLFALKISSIAISKYVYLFLLSSFSKKNMKQYIKGVGNPSIDKKSIRSLFIALPPLIEQKKIVEILDNILTIIIKNIALKKQAELLKKGLMQQLLTGKIRVRVQRNEQ